MNSTHQVRVVRITDIEKHPNADTLSIVRIGGYQCVVKTTDFKAGDLAVYVQPDSVMPQEDAYAFLWAGREFPDSPVPEKYRRITVRKFRKEWSEGLLLPARPTYFKDTTTLTGNYVIWRGEDDCRIVQEGDDVAEFLGITHYDPPEPETPQQTHNYDRGVRPKSLKGWWYWLLRKLGWDVNGPTGGDNERAPKTFPPVYDVEAFKNFPQAFEPGEMVVVTEKIHGSNARYTFQNGRMYAGSRQLWKSEKSGCIWRKCLAQHPWIEEWCRTHEGYTLFGEVVPTQKFKGGQAVNYGAAAGEILFFIFDFLSPEGEWVAWDWAQVHTEAPYTVVPILYVGPFDEGVIRKLADGPSQVPGAQHIREGCVIRAVPGRHVTGLGRLQLKIVSNEFLERT